MLNGHCPQPGRLDRSGLAGLPPRLGINADTARAPITFGWALYTRDGFSGRYHLETLYRLDRVGAHREAAGAPAALQPSQYYGQSVQALREMLRVRQHALLPAPPAGCRWIGPQLIEDAPVPATSRSGAAGQAAAVPDTREGAPAWDRSARLQFARTLAAGILRRKASL